VESAGDVMEAKLAEVGRSELLRRNGHYSVWLGPKGKAAADAEHRANEQLGVPTQYAPDELLKRAAETTRQSLVAGLWFPKSGHVLDPAQVARAFAAGATANGATFVRATVSRIQPRGDQIEILSDGRPLSVPTAVICLGAWSRPFLATFGLNAPLEAERGYHVELPNQTPLVDAPLLYADHSIVVTPMASRLRASSYLEFGGLNSPPDPRKPARLRARLRELGYRCEPDGPSWMGPRPTLPDYLPGIGRAEGPHNLFYAVGHQHLGLTLSAVTSDLVTDLVMGQTPRFDVSGFDLRRFGRP
jgi:D-amino-acid dehydrogenase